MKKKSDRPAYQVVLYAMNPEGETEESGSVEGGCWLSLYLFLR